MSAEHSKSYQYYGRFIDVAPIPSHCIESVELNNEALEFLPKSHEELINEDTLISLAQTPSFRYPDSEKTIAVPFDYGRSLPLAYVDVPFANNHGTVITGKGVGPSGSYYSRSLGVDFSYTKNPDVLGLFGEKDAKFDMRASNVLLAAGLRTSLTLGYLVLNPERYKDHLKYVWNDRDSKDYIEDAFDQIGSNRDLPVYHFRLGSHTQRLKLFNKIDFEFIDGKNKKFMLHDYRHHWLKELLHFFVHLQVPLHFEC